MVSAHLKLLRKREATEALNALTSKARGRPARAIRLICRPVPYCIKARTCTKDKNIVTAQDIYKCLTSLFQGHNLQELRRSASLATKVFIQRDYSDGTMCQFQTKFPPELDSRIERQLFEETVKNLNNYYVEAEKIGGSSYLEGCLACATAYFIFLCMETHYEKVLKKISKYIQEQNEKIYAPRGLLITDPVERGMRVVSFKCLSTPPLKRH
ncbi:golgin subfamily A member 7B-like [Rhinatrema bivittatum]|uniref:golgin subfamily A member 7B-like n=1 Tax=Rhinatrema bivittatum TaxID=194408 RepID=UPI001127B021|nr:golgin subfamily A member 7B-like [Rhinatrema bivittatum]